MDLLDRARSMRLRHWPGYVMAVFAPLCAVLVRIALGDLLDGFPFITFFPAVFLTAIISDRVAATVAALISVLFANYFWIGAVGVLLPITMSDWIGNAFFILICGAFIILVDGLNQALDRLAATSAALKLLNADLEQRVSDRTAVLARTNEKLLQAIAARETAEARVRQSQKMEAIGQLAGGIAHDFNNMLSVIIGSLDMTLRRIGRGDFDIARYLDNAMDGAKRSSVLTQRLLAFSRQQALNPVVLNVNVLIAGMEQLLRRTLSEAIALELVLSGGLWLTRIDPGELESAILNLCVNARDAMPDHGKLTIETMNTHLDDAYARDHADVAAGQYVMVAVSDTGMGMPTDIAERAFDPFFTTKETGKGTGLGLSQVYGFVKQSGGHIKIYSEEGQGTTIKIYLPRSLMKATDKQNVKEDFAELPMALPKEVVLVVEDEASVRETTAGILEDLGYTVLRAATGEQALQLLEDNSAITLLLTDVVMPGMSGAKLAEIVHEKRPDLKVLYTTGYTSNAIVHNGILDAGVELITKPFTVSQLAYKVRKVIG